MKCAVAVSAGGWSIEAENALPGNQPARFTFHTVTLPGILPLPSHSLPPRMSQWGVYVNPSRDSITVRTMTRKTALVTPTYFRSWSTQKA